MKRSAPAVLGKLALAGCVGLLVGWPFLGVVTRALKAGSRNGFLTDGHGQARPFGLAVQTLNLVVLTEVLVLPLGLCLAFLLFRTRVPGRVLATALVLLGLFIPLPLQAVCWLGAFGNQGRQQALGTAPWLVGILGASVVHAIAALPWVVLLAGLSLRTVEPELEEVALLEMSVWRVLFMVTLRRALGGIAAAALAVAILTATDMTVTDLIPLRTYAEEAYTLAQQGADLAELAWRATAPPLFILGGLTLGIGYMLAKLEPGRLALLASPGRHWRLGAWRWPIGVCVWLCVSALFALPLYGLIWRAGRVGPGLVAGAGARWSLAGLLGTLRAAWADLGPSRLTPTGDFFRFELGTLGNSIVWASSGAALAALVAWGLCWSARQSWFWRFVTLFVVALGLATPAPIVGLALKLAYVRFRFLTETPGLLVIAYAARTLPFAVVVLWPAVRMVPQSWLETSALAGLGPVGQAWHVALPTTWPSLLVAGLLAFSVALGELPAAYFVYAPGFEPLSISVWSLLHMGVESRLAGITLWLLLLVGFVGAIAFTLARLTKGPGAGLDTP
jgi:iron(III) transport system permease protein